MAAVHLECSVALVSACIMSGPDLHTPASTLVSCSAQPTMMLSQGSPLSGPSQSDQLLNYSGWIGGSFGGCL